ncbi:MAG: hypothetical protein KDD44_04875, partial [Bdellovibrionales bacterium]|nr:hypothetical protein [Bdellovibrionales bacterium]
TLTPGQPLSLVAQSGPFKTTGGTVVSKQPDPVIGGYLLVLKFPVTDSQKQCTTPTVSPDVIHLEQSGLDPVEAEASRTNVTSEVKSATTISAQVSQ